MRLTRQRQVVLQTVKENRCHPDADSIYHILKPDHPELSLGTVYRNLNVLSENGMISRITTPFNREHYDGCTEPHYHFFCESCHQIYDLDMAYRRDLDEEAESAGGHQIRRHEMVFHGICVNCSRNAEADAPEKP